MTKKLKESADDRTNAGHVEEEEEEGKGTETEWKSTVSIKKMNWKTLPWWQLAGAEMTGVTLRSSGGSSDPVVPSPAPFPLAAASARSSALKTPPAPHATANNRD